MCAWSGLAVLPSGWTAESDRAADDLFTDPAIRHLEITIPRQGMETLRQYNFRAHQGWSVSQCHQCVLHGATGEAWFELDSISIRRLAPNVSKSIGRSD